MLSSIVAALVLTTAAPAEKPLAPLASAIAAAPGLETTLEPWMVDRKVSRSGALKAMYGTLVVLQALDLYSTQRALDSGGSEINPLMEQAAGQQASMIAAKAVSTALSVYFAERAWKKNRKGAVALMAVVNGVTTVVIANNMRNRHR